MNERTKKILIGASIAVAVLGVCLGIFFIRKNNAAKREAAEGWTPREEEMLAQLRQQVQEDVARYTTEVISKPDSPVAGVITQYVEREVNTKKKDILEEAKDQSIETLDLSPESATVRTIAEVAANSIDTEKIKKAIISDLNNQVTSDVQSQVSQVTSEQIRILEEQLKTELSGMSTLSDAEKQAIQDGATAAAVSNIQATLASLRTQISQAAQTGGKNYDSTITSLQNAITELQNTYNQKLAAISSENSSLKDSLASLRSDRLAQYNELKNQIEKMNTELASASTGSSSNLSKLESDLNKEIEYLKKQVAINTTNISNNTTNISQNTKDITKTEKEIEKVSNNSSTSTPTTVDTKTTEQVKELIKQLETVKEQVSKSESGNLSKELEEQAAKLIQLSEDYRTSQEEIEKAKKAAEDLQKIIDDIQKNGVNASSMASIKAQLEEIKKNSGGTIKQEDIDRILAMIERQNGEVAQLSASLNGVIAQVESLISQERGYIRDVAHLIEKHYTDGDNTTLQSDLEKALSSIEYLMTVNTGNTTVMTELNQTKETLERLIEKLSGGGSLTQEEINNLITYLDRVYNVTNPVNNQDLTDMRNALNTLIDANKAASDETASEAARAAAATALEQAKANASSVLETFKNGDFKALQDKLAQDEEAMAALGDQITAEQQARALAIQNAVDGIAAAYVTTDALQTALTALQQTAANTAQEKDNALRTTLEAQISAVNTAVGSAQTTANNAQTAADNAQTTANTANAAAGTAQATANSATTAASNAQDTANTAVVGVNDLNSALNAMRGYTVSGEADPTKDYAVGQHVTYNNTVYEVKQAYAANTYTTVQEMIENHIIEPTSTMSIEDIQSAIENGDVHIYVKYADKDVSGGATDADHVADTCQGTSKWMGVIATTEDTAPSDVTKYKWTKFRDVTITYDETKKELIFE